MLLKILMDFTENFTKGILNAKHELILIIFHSFQNSYIDEVDTSFKIIVEWSRKT